MSIQANAQGNSAGQEGNELSERHLIVEIVAKEVDPSVSKCVELGKLVVH
jgi:hypothetical protein